MSDKKPKVFPSLGKEEQQPVQEEAKLSFEQEKAQAVNELYTNNTGLSEGQYNALLEMKKRTDEQLRMLKERGEVKDISLSENNNKIIEQKKTREDQINKNIELMEKYNNTVNEKLKQQKPMENLNYNQNSTSVVDYGKTPNNLNPQIIELSQPNFNSPFDVIALPSEGKVYKTKKPKVKLSFMTTSDENILTSPNLLQNGDFLEILINRKLLETDLRYKDLTIGDRNAIMIWLRATAFGEMYPVVVFDENDSPFETEINLNNLKIKKLGAEPDAEGYFDFQLPISKDIIKFKFLTCGDIDEIDAQLKHEKEQNVLINNTITYTFERIIVEVNGSRDKNFIKEYSKNMRIGDSKALNEYFDKIQSGVDLNIEVGTPGGGSVKTFLPLNINFFWPDARV